jgi:hypothetical protein
VAYDKSERTMIQIPMPPAMIKALQNRLKKLESVAKSEESTDKPRLNDIYDDSIKWFLKNAKSDPTLIYLVSPRPQDPKLKNLYRSMWVKSELVEKVKKVADRDSVSVNRVIYSALEHYLSAARRGILD